MNSKTRTRIIALALFAALALPLQRAARMKLNNITPTNTITTSSSTQAPSADRKA